MLRNVDDNQICPSQLLAELSKYAHSFHIFFFTILLSFTIFVQLISFPAEIAVPAPPSLIHT
jgi:hypothetical protein